MHEKLVCLQFGYKNDGILKGLKIISELRPHKWQEGNSTIEFSSFSKNYGKVRAVVQLKLKLGPGIFGLIGPNGAGKTTCVRALAGLIRPSEGSVRIDGHDTWSDTRSAKSLTGFCFENQLYPDGLSGMDYLTLVCRLRGHPKDHAQRLSTEALEVVELSDSSDNWVSRYSQGMRQRLSVIAACIGKPKYVVLDEPTSNLDPEGRRIILDLVQRLNVEEGISFVISSHVLHELERVVTEIGFLKEGKLLISGIPSELFAGIEGDEMYVRVSQPELILQRLIERGEITSHRVETDALIVGVVDPARFSDVLSEIVRQTGSTLYELRSTESKLDRIFTEFMGRDF